MFYILNYQYSPNTAVANRLLAYYKALDQLGIEANIVYIHPNNSYTKISEKYSKLKVTYLWNKFLPYRGCFRKLTYSLYVKKFLSMLKPGDIVYTYSIGALTRACLSVHGVKLYAERTEHPQASSGFSSPVDVINKEEYLDTLKRLSGLFVISEPLKKYYGQLGLDNSKIEIINMIVDSSRFANIEKTRCKDRYIAYCGTASNNKDGVDELIRAFAIVTKHISDVKLYIIGKTPSKEQLFGNLELVKNLGVEDKVVFTGMVKAKDMPRLLKNAEILALDRPDNLQAKYGFPTKLGEYLLTKNPVVVTSVGDIPKFLKDRESALIAKPSKADDFASKLIWLLTHKEEGIRIGYAGYKVAREHFDYFTETKKIVDFMNL